MDHRVVSFRTRIEVLSPTIIYCVLSYHYLVTDAFDLLGLIYAEW